MTEAEKQAAIEAAGAQIAAAQKALQAGINALSAAVDIVVSTAPVVVPTPEPVPEVPATGATSHPFQTMVWAAQGRTLTVNTDPLIVKDKVIIQLFNGQSVNVIGVTASKQSGRSDLAIDQTVKAAEVANKIATVKDRYPVKTETPAPPVVVVPVPEAPAPETPPATTTPAPAPKPELVSVAVRNLDYDDWPFGVWKGPQAGLAPDAAQLALNPESFAEGCLVMLGDGSTRTITGNDGNLWFDGDALNPATCGYPAVVQALKVASTPVVPRPANTTPIITAPGRKRGRLCLNLGAGAGGDTVIPGMQGRNRGYASEAEIVHAVNVLKCRHFRIGGLWETFIQPGGKSELYTGTVNGGPSAIDELIRVLSSLADKGCTAMPDPFHNYGGYSSTGTSANRIKIGDPGGPSVKRAVLDHKAVLLAVKANPKAWSALTEYDTMNEWLYVAYTNIKAFHQEFLDICGPIMDGKVPVIEGDLWSSTVHWATLNPGFADLVYPAGVSKIKCSGHLYLDPASSGFYDKDEVSQLDAAAGMTTDNIGIMRMLSMEAACEAAGVDMSIGEHNVPGDKPKLIKGSENMIRYCISKGIDVHIFANSTWLDETHNILKPKNQPYLEMLMGIWAEEAAYA
jgi:hypothetical protein